MNIPIFIVAAWWSLFFSTTEDNARKPVDCGMVKNLKSQLGEAKEKITNLEKQISELNIPKKEYDKKIDEFESKISDLNKEKKSLKKKEEIVTVKFNDLQTKHKTLQGQKDNFEKNVNEFFTNAINTIVKTLLPCSFDLPPLTLGGERTPIEGNIEQYHSVVLTPLKNTTLKGNILLRDIAENESILKFVEPDHWTINSDTKPCIHVYQCEDNEIEVSWDTALQTTEHNKLLSTEIKLELVTEILDPRDPKKQKFISIEWDCQLNNKSET